MSSSAREQERVQELCAAAMRALAGQPALQLRGRRLFRNGVAARAPAAHLSSGHDDLASWRGTADGLALRELETDEALHISLAPPAPMARSLFDLLEQYRVEAVVPDEYEGVRSNLRHRHQAWADAFETERMLETEHGLLVYAVAQSCRSRLTGIPLDELVADRIEGVRMKLQPHIGAEMAALHSLRRDQRAYAAVAATIAARVAALLESQAAAQPRERAGRPDPRQRSIGLWLAQESSLESGFPVAGSAASRLLADGGASYQVFTRAYDRELDAASLVRPQLLRELRARLDEDIARAPVNVGRLARHLQAAFAHPADDGWSSAQEEGRIDGRMLSQLVASPTERRLFTQPRSAPAADCLVTFLLDCSGSMKEYAPRVAVIVDVLVRAMEHAGIATEVLGFTTGAWNGGRARRDWLRAGSPAHPGRLNEADHLVFKSADQSWRRQRRSIAALLKTDFYREGIDGEAVQWACRRMAARPERRRVLAVVSDGSPMDGATALANDAGYLDHHLQDVVASESTGDLRICGLGVGLDLSPYYEHCRVLDISRANALPMFLEICDLLSRRRSSARGRRT